jgi:AraC-like DNA-binding protein
LRAYSRKRIKYTRFESRKNKNPMLNLTKYLKIAQSGRYVCTADWTWNKKGSPSQDFDLWVILDGKGRLTTPKKTYELSSGDCFLLRGSDNYYGDNSRIHPLKVIFIHFDFCDENGGRIRPDEAELLSLYRKINSFPFFLKILDRVLYYYQRNMPLKAEEWLRTALIEIEYQDRIIQITESETDEASGYIDKICRKITEYPELNFYLPEIASGLSYSTDHFSRLFKQRKKITFRDFVINSRIEMAKLHLRSSSAKVSRIAELLGYSDIYLFSKQFKKKTGLTPSDYRHKKRL